MNYQSSLEFERTAEEYQDQEASWKRNDKAFFAAGACHILAYVFMEVADTPENKKIIFIKPEQTFGSTGTHVYVQCGEWAFDFNGWIQEADLLKAHETAYREKYPNWNYSLQVLEEDIENFCIHNNHLPPNKFAGDVISRAKKNYLKQFTLTTPS